MTVDIVPISTTVDPVQAARESGLRYVCDDQKGIHRKPRSNGFVYVDRTGQPVRDEETLARIRSLVIPPAWSDVWICASPNGHLQATGRDARGRKQYRYHPRWSATRGENKYSRMIAFGHALHRIRRKVARDLALPGLSKEKVLAAVVRLMDRTCIRVGNEEYRKQNGSYGLTTLRDQHAEIDRSRLEFNFKGKSGQRHYIALDAPRLARIVRQCRDLPGSELFQYIDDEGKHQPIDSGDVNEYLREITHSDFTSKDFRTWSGTVEAAIALEAIGPFDSQAQAKRNVAEAVRRASQRLGNRPAVCRKHYIHPAVIDAYLEGAPVAVPLNGKAVVNDPASKQAEVERRAVEKTLLEFLEKQERAAKKNGAAKARKKGSALCKTTSQCAIGK